MSNTSNRYECLQVEPLKGDSDGDDGFQATRGDDTGSELPTTSDPSHSFPSASTSGPLFSPTGKNSKSQKFRPLTAEENPPSVLSTEFGSMSSRGLEVSESYGADYKPLDKPGLRVRGKIIEDDEHKGVASIYHRPATGSSSGKGAIASVSQAKGTASLIDDRVLRQQGGPPMRWRKPS